MFHDPNVLLRLARNPLYSITSVLSSNTLIGSESNQDGLITDEVIGANLADFLLLIHDIASSVRLSLLKNDNQAKYSAEILDEVEEKEEGVLVGESEDLDDATDVDTDAERVPKSDWSLLKLMRAVKKPFSFREYVSSSSAKLVDEEQDLQGLAPGIPAVKVVEKKTPANMKVASGLGIGVLAALLSVVDSVASSSDSSHLLILTLLLFCVVLLLVGIVVKLVYFPVVPQQVHKSVVREFGVVEVPDYL